MSSKRGLVKTTRIAGTNLRELAHPIKDIAGEWHERGTVCHLSRGGYDNQRRVRYVELRIHGRAVRVEAA
jgi:hypothetical protein